MQVITGMGGSFAELVKKLYQYGALTASPRIDPFKRCFTSVGYAGAKPTQERAG